MTVLSVVRRPVFQDALVAISCGGLLVLSLTLHELLTEGLLLFAVLIVVVAMLSSLRLSVILAAGTFPIGDVFMFGTAGTLSKFIMFGLFGSFAFHVFRGRITPRWNAVNYGALLWFGLAAASMFWSREPQMTHLGTLAQLLVMAYVFAMIVADRPSLAPTIMWSFAISGAALAAIATFRFFSNLPTMGPQRTSASPMQDVAHFASFLVPAVILTLNLAMQPSQRRALRWLYVLIGVVLIAGLLVSGTRSAWLAVSIGLALSLASRITFKRLLYIGLIGAALVLTTSQLPALSQFIAVRSDSAVDNGGAGRLDIWRVGIGLVDRSPLLGLGLGEFHLHFDPEAIRAAPMTGASLRPGLNRAPHSIYLGTVVELGIVGFTVLGVWLAGTLLRLNGSGIYLIAIRASLLAYLVQGAFLDILNRKYFWLIVGLAEGCRYLVTARSRLRQQGGVESEVRD